MNEEVKELNEEFEGGVDNDGDDEIKIQDKGHAETDQQARKRRYDLSNKGRGID